MSEKPLKDKMFDLWHAYEEFGLAMEGNPFRCEKSARPTEAIVLVLEGAGRIQTLESRLAELEKAATPEDIEAMARVCLDFQQKMIEKGDDFGRRHWEGVTKRLYALAAALGRQREEEARLPGAPTQGQAAGGVG